MLKLLLFIPIFLFSMDFFPLPDEAYHFNETLNRSLKNAQREILIITPYINNYPLQKALKKVAKQGIKVIIISDKKAYKADRSSQLSLYKNISIYELKSEAALKGSSICIDNKTLFLLSNALDFKAVKREYGFASRSQNSCKKRAKTLILRSTKKAGEVK